MDSCHGSEKPLLTWKTWTWHPLRKETSNHWNRHEHIPGIHKDLQFPPKPNEVSGRDSTSIGCRVVVMNIYPSQNCCFFFLRIPDTPTNLSQSLIHSWCFYGDPFSLLHIYIYQTKINNNNKKQTPWMVGSCISQTSDSSDSWFHYLSHENRWWYVHKHRKKWRPSKGGLRKPPLSLQLCK